MFYSKRSMLLLEQKIRIACMVLQKLWPRSCGAIARLRSIQGINRYYGQTYCTSCDSVQVSRCNMVGYISGLKHETLLMRTSHLLIHYRLFEIPTSRIWKQHTGRYAGSPHPTPPLVSAPMCWNIVVMAGRKHPKRTYFTRPHLTLRYLMPILPWPCVQDKQNKDGNCQKIHTAGWGPCTKPLFTSLWRTMKQTDWTPTHTSRAVAKWCCINRYVDLLSSWPPTSVYTAITSACFLIMWQNGRM